MTNLTSKNIVSGFLAITMVPMLALAKEQPPANRVPIEAARKTAATAYNGKIQGEELEFEGGRWIYSFDLKGNGDKRVHEIHVDAISGKVVGNHTESASDEKKEAREDAAEGTKK